MKKKILSWLLMMTMMIAMLPAVTMPVSAAILPVYVNGIDIATDADHMVDCGAGSAVFDMITGTLTLTNATIDVLYEHDDTQYGIYSERDLTIVLTEDETIHSINIAENNDGGNIGIFVDGDLTISSAAEDAILDILSQSCAEAFNGYGIYTTGTLTVNNCGVEANSRTYNGTEAESYGIYAIGDIVISNSDIWAFARKATDVSAGIYSEGNISITNNDPNHGIYVEGNAKSASTPAVSYGIYAAGTLTIDGAKNPPSPDWVVGNSNSSASSYCAIYAGAASGAITLIDMRINTTSESANPDAGGVISNDGHYIAKADGTTMPAYADLWGSVGSYLQSPEQSTAPTFIDPIAMKAAAYQKSVEYTLASALPTGTLKVYGAASGGTALSAVTASASGTTLTLTSAGADIPEQDYWVTLTETGKGESARVQLTVAPEADVVLVSDEAGLAAIAADVNSGTDYADMTIKMSADITLTASPWTPIGTPLNPFKGTFDGNNHTISGLVVSTSSRSQGLFGYTVDADIKNLIIANPASSGTNTEVYDGILAGQFWVEGGTHKIENVHVTGTGTLTGIYGVIGNLNVGVVYGTSASAIINNCSSAVNLSGDGYMGGLISEIGTDTQTTLLINNCYTTGDITSTNNYTGGLIGQTWTSGTLTISGCYTTGDISGTTHVGGIVGNFVCSGEVSSIENCYSLGDITASGGFAGGIAGYAYYQSASSVERIVNVFATGTVTATYDGGGIVGYANGNSSGSCLIDHAVSLNKAIINSSPGPNDEYFHRIAGEINPGTTLSNCYGFKNMTIIDSNNYVDDATPAAGAVAAGIDGLGISKTDVNKAANWLTYLNVANGQIGYGKWTNGTHKLPHLTALSSDDDFAMPDHLAYKALFSGSSGTRSYTAGNTAGIYIDSQIEVYGPEFSGAKVIIDGYDAAADIVTWDLSGTGITVEQSGGQDIAVSGAAGTITFTGNDTAAHYQQVLRSIHLVTTSVTGSRSISFSLGESAAYSGHYYEFVGFTAGTQKSWEQSRDAATRMEFGGQSGYLATIQSPDENNFIASKLGANGWIGALGTMNGGVKEWKWVTDPDPAVAGTIFFTQDKDHNSSGYNSSMVMGTTADGAYSNFNGGEPNGRLITPADSDATNTEWCGEIYSSGASAGKWNDLQNIGYASDGDLTNVNSQAAKGYVVEFSIIPDEVVVIKTVNIAAQSSGGPRSSETTNSPIAQVNGQPTVSGTINTTTSGDRTTTTITVNQASLFDQLAQAGSRAVVTIPFTQPSDVTAGELNGQMVREMENREAMLVIQTPTASYSLPAAQINISEISKALGTNVTLSDIKVSVSISSPPDQTVRVVQQAADSQNLTLIVPAVNFEITCTYNGKTVDVSKFNAYVERRIAIPEGVDPTKITTGIVVNPDGTTRHVPTRITVVNGVYYAVINSLTNSTYSVVWHPYEFSDVAKHWAKASINNMGSRMVVSGVGEGAYEPDRNMTRAEFAAIIVKALGLAAGEGTKTFSDVRSSDWFNGYVKTAAERGIITGYSNGGFGPKDAITREQAMTMIARAMAITKLESGLQSGNVSALLANYTDSGSISGYAASGIAECVKAGVVSGRTKTTIAPKANITRAEVAVIVERLLKKSDLID